jgi:alpha-L-fucosidase
MTMQPWFTDAKLGIFLHWGIYAVDGVAESWSFFNGSVPYDKYMKQLDGFTASEYDPEEWARLFRRAGARYAVLTAKHHDGVALWDTGHGDLSVAKRSPAGRDLLRPYVDALRAADLKVGLYFSHLDWSHPDYASVGYEGPDLPPDILAGGPHPFSVPPNERHPEPDPAAWERFLAFHRGQLHELVDGYAPDLLWFDGQWERGERQWRMKELREDLLSRKTDLILNARMLGHGDYATPEQGVPITPPDGPWELCYTVNNSWGFQTNDHDHKPLGLLIRTFSETIAAGGNLLLDVGPREDGTIPAEQASRLEGLGDWIGRNHDAVFGTTAGIPAGHFHGPTTVAADRRTLFLFCQDAPRDLVTVRGLKNRVRRVSVVGSGEALTHRTYGGFGEAPGVLAIDAPGSTDRHTTVLALELDGELELYRGGGHG